MNEKEKERVHWNVHDNVQCMYLNKTMPAKEIKKAIFIHECENIWIVH